MAATEGKHFADTASASVGSSLGAMTVVSPVEGSVTTVEVPEPELPGIIALVMPHTPKASTQATSAPAKAMRKVLPPLPLGAACWACIDTGSAS